MKSIALVVATTLVVLGCGSPAKTTSKAKLRQVVKISPEGPCAFSVNNPGQVLKHRRVVSRNPVRYKDYECLNGEILDRNKPCPGLANPWCKANWEPLDVGMPEDEVKVLLGAPERIQPWSRSSNWYYMGSRGSVRVADGKLTGFKKPAAQDYYFLKPIASAPVNSPVANLISSCPGLGQPDCKVNWAYIKQGIAKTQLEMLLGSPDSIKNVKVGRGAVQFDETWIYKPDAEIRLFNGLVVGYDKPGSYKYLGGVQQAVPIAEDL